ncbi:MAG: dienelactone hydrolase family protein [Pseudomonadota bacterium]|nr:dienelactone hydrolase family protein [Pseudomonadota bacterium]
MTHQLCRQDLPELIEVTTPQATAAMIWLHGLGASGDDFVPVFAAIAGRLPCATKALFPHAPRAAVTFAGGEVMPSWYDITAARPARVVNEADLQASAARIHHLIGQLNKEGIPSQRIVIAGFSQGGAVALETALTYPGRLGGLICLSTYLARTVKPAAANAELPVFIAHGTADSVVPCALGETTRQSLQAMQLQPAWHTYPMDHEVCPAEIDDICRFVSDCLS